MAKGDPEDVAPHAPAVRVELVQLRVFDRRDGFAVLPRRLLSGGRRAHRLLPRFSSSNRTGRRSAAERSAAKQRRVVSNASRGEVIGGSPSATRRTMSKAWPCVLWKYAKSTSGSHVWFSTQRLVCPHSFSPNSQRLTVRGKRS